MPPFEAAVAEPFRAPPHSLEVAVDPSKADAVEPEVTSNSAPLRRLLWLLGYHSDEAITIRGATNLYQAVCQQADTNALHDRVGLPPSFYSRWCLLAIHIWMLLVRLRADGDGTSKLRQELYDLFQEDVEVRVRQQISIRIAGTLEELEKDFYGSAIAMDKALQGECQLWEPILRNVYANDDARKASAQTLARYVERELQCLQLTSSDALLRGNIQFTTA